jgi:hypothetical protein
MGFQSAGFDRCAISLGSAALPQAKSEVGGLVCANVYDHGQEKSSPSKASTAAPIATGRNEPVPGWDLHPLWTKRLSRRTRTIPLSGVLINMNINQWVERTDLTSPVTGIGVLLVGRDGVAPTKAIGSGVFVAERLVMTVKHVVQGYWQLYGNPNVVLERQGKKLADFEMFAVQAPGDSAATALWAVRKIALCPYSDLALISVEPVDELAKEQQTLKAPILSILPPSKGEKIAAFGYASTSTVIEEGQQVKFGLNPTTSKGVVTEVYPEARDSALLSFPSFELETHFIGGMSGGPIFNEAGELCGLICSGYDDAPVAYGVALWPITGIRIDHRVQGVVSPGPYTILELAKAGLMNVRDWQYVEASVEPYVDANGTRKIRLRPPQ